MPRGLVLNFHRELDAASFEEKILAVKSKYRFVCLEELTDLIANKKSLKNICHISFDDGEISFYEIVYPILKKHSVPVSLFVSPKIIESTTNYWFQEIESFNDTSFRSFIASYIMTPIHFFSDCTTLSILKCFRINTIKKIIAEYLVMNPAEKGPNFNMNVSQLLEVEQSKLVTIGAHTLDHPILMNETNENSFFEIAESVVQLQKMLGHKVKHFAYPNGAEGYDFSDREVDFLNKAGISLSFTTDVDHLLNLSSIYKVPRIYYPTTLGLRANHPLLLFRMAMGHRWPVIRKRTASEKEIRDKSRTILNANSNWKES